MEFICLIGCLVLFCFISLGLFLGGIILMIAYILAFFSKMFEDVKNKIEKTLDINKKYCKIKEETNEDDMV